MEDLEEVYSEGLEKEGEIFIEGLQNKKSLAELEKRYSQKVKEIRRIYSHPSPRYLEIDEFFVYNRFGIFVKAPPTFHLVLDNKTIKVYKCLP